MFRTTQQVSRSTRFGTALLTFGAASLLAAVPAQAQFGAKLGFSFATLSNARPDFGTQTGFAAGISLALPFSGPLSLQPEALYVQKGTEASAAASGISGDLELSYIEIPVLLRLDFPTPGVRPFAVAGPSISFRTECTIDGVDCGQAFREQDYGVAIGAGVRFGGVLGLSLEGRYTWGLKDIHDVGAGIDHKTRAFVALAGISF